MILRTTEDLAGIEEAWWRLWARDPQATPFQSPAWLINWWRAFSPGTLHAIALQDGDELAALAPLYLEAETGRLLPIGISISDRLDLMAQDEAARAALWQDVTHLSEGRRIEIECLAAQSHARAIGAAQEYEHETSPSLALGPQWDAHVPARKRRQWRRAWRAACAHGDFAITQAADASEFLDHLFRLHAARWAERGESGLLADERVRKFHRLALPAMMKAGLARVSLLVFQGDVRGAYYGLAAKGRAFAYIGGFDPACAQESPGTLLIADALQQALREGCESLDFLRGRESYKYAWGAQDAPLYRRIWDVGT